jgi:hypothetical protein
MVCVLRNSVADAVHNSNESLLAFSGAREPRKSFSELLPNALDKHLIRSAGGEELLHLALHRAGDFVARRAHRNFTEFVAVFGESAGMVDVNTHSPLAQSLEVRAAK